MICKFLSEPSYSLTYYTIFSYSLSEPVITTHPEFYKITDYISPRSEDPATVKYILTDANQNVYTLAKNYKEYSFKTRASEILLVNSVPFIDVFNIREDAFYYDLGHIIQFKPVTVVEEERDITYYVIDFNSYLDSDNTRTEQIFLPYTSLEATGPFYFTSIAHDIELTIDSETSKEIRIPIGCSVCALNSNTVVFYGGEYDGSCTNKIFIFKKLPEFESKVYRVLNVEGMLPTPRTYAAVCRYNDGLLIHGGKLENSLGCIFSLSFSRDEMTENTLKARIKHFVLGNSPRRYHHSLVECLDRFYIIGGAVENKVEGGKIYSFNMRDLVCQEVNYKGDRIPFQYQGSGLNVVVKGHLIFVNDPNYKESKSSVTQASMWMLNTRNMIGNLFKYPNNGYLSYMYDSPGPYVAVFQDRRITAMKRLITSPLYDCQLPPISQNSILDFMEHLYNSQYNADVKIITQDGELTCHSLILGMRKRDGTYLASLISKNKEIRLQSERSGILNVVLKYLYTDQLDTPEKVIMSQHVKCRDILFVSVYDYITELLSFAKRFKMNDLIVWLNVLVEFDGEFVHMNKFNILNDLKDLLHFSIYHNTIELNNQISTDSCYEYQWNTPDLLISTNKRTIGVNKLFLMMRSEFFRGYCMLGNEEVISLEEYNDDVVIYMLKYVYYDHKDIPYHYFIEMMQLAKQLSIHGLVIEVETKICYSINTKNLVDIAESAWIQNAEYLVRFITDFVKHFAKTEKMRNQLMELKERCPELGEQLLEIYLEAREAPLYKLPTDDNMTYDEKVNYYLGANPFPSIHDPLPKGLQINYLKTELEHLIRDMESFRGTETIFSKPKPDHNKLVDQETKEEKYEMKKGNRFEFSSSEDSGNEED